MRVIDIIKNSLNEEKRVKEGIKRVVLFDIDDTLLKPQNIFIWKKKNGIDTKLTPAQYAQEDVVSEKNNGAEYSYKEFRDPKCVEASITSGKPILKNVKMINDHIRAGWEVGILTARGLEDVIYTSINNWLSSQRASGLAKNYAAPLARNLVHAINDEAKKYSGITDFEKKSKVIERFTSDPSYDRVKVVDDDPKNIKAFKELQKKYKNLVVVTAWAHEGE